jgi:hypothetical protein
VIEEVEQVARKRTAAGIALVVAMTIGGCSVSPGAAAVVDGRRISQAQLEDAHADFSTIAPEAQPAQVLVAMIVAPLFIDAAVENGVGVSSQEARTFIEQNATAAGVDPATEFGDGIVQIVRFTMAAQRLQTLGNGTEILNEVAASVEDMDIDVNPRYGELDTSTGSIVPLAQPWIVSDPSNA